MYLVVYLFVHQWFLTEFIRAYLQIQVHVYVYQICRNVIK